MMIIIIMMMMTMIMMMMMMMTMTIMIMIMIMIVITIIINNNLASLHETNSHFHIKHLIYIYIVNIAQFTLKENGYHTPFHPLDVQDQSWWVHSAINGMIMLTWVNQIHSVNLTKQYIYV